MIKLVWNVIRDWKLEDEFGIILSHRRRGLDSKTA